MILIEYQQYTVLSLNLEFKWLVNYALPNPKFYFPSSGPRIWVLLIHLEMQTCLSAPCISIL